MLYYSLDIFSVINISVNKEILKVENATSDCADGYNRLLKNVLMFIFMLL